MSVILNEPAILALTRSPAGPVFLNIERRAEQARKALQDRIDQIIANPAVRPVAGVQITEEGAVIGIEAHGRVADYIGEKLGVREPWWQPFGRPAALI